jgi:hypothetical protein
LTYSGDFISMAGEEDWLFRPVLRGLLRAESLIDGTVDLAYVAILNEVLDVEQENALRMRKEEGANHGR